MKNIDFTITSSKTFDDAVQSVRDQTEKVGYRVLHIHDIQETLGKKGLIIEPLKIIEICNAKNAHQAIQTDIRLALCLPCKINIYVKSGKTYISGMMPSVIQTFFPNVDKHFINEIETKIKLIVNASL